MSFDLLERARRNVGVRLGLWYAAVFTLSSVVLLATAYFLLARAIGSKDREVLQARLRKYAAVYDNGGLPRLRRAIQQETGSQKTCYVRLVNAWNGADGSAFAESFADDADFVNVYGMYGHGRESICQAHEYIFRTVYAGSTMTFKLERVRLLREDVAIGHIRAHLEVPQGPMAGAHDALPSMVLTREPSGWSVAAFHNTFVRNPPV